LKRSLPIPIIRNQANLGKPLQEHREKKKGLRPFYSHNPLKHKMENFRVTGSYVLKTLWSLDPKRVRYQAALRPDVSYL
jgi:hypothetical protein